ncbi:hypothetical protein [Allokutzneria sp. NRRL B-24872]|uniref:hypothetical protein n=1 Tax=Allokutzneria sp. NRRL B-24872 TaxID=1137961 RepID=UPI000A3CB6AB|nr:hypothetical protein [Allokutzneria sp. NRRL B-24872]
MLRKLAVLGIAVFTFVSVSGFAAAPVKVPFSCHTKDFGAAPCGIVQKGGDFVGRTSVGIAERQVIWTNRGKVAVKVSLTVEPYAEGPGAGIPVRGNYEVG